MKCRFFQVEVAIAALLSVVSGAVTAGDQLGILPPEVARRNGLDRVWATQVDVGRNRGRVAHATLHVSTTLKQTIFEVLHDGPPLVVSERQLDGSGKRLGVTGARAYAEDRVIELKRTMPPGGSEPRIERRDVPEITLYATTTMGVVHAIDGETGKTKWLAEVGHHDYPISEAAANDNFVAVLSGSSLIVVNAADGKLVWNARTAGVPASSPALTDTHVFVPTVIGSMESHLLANQHQTPWNYRTAGRTRVPPIGDSRSVAWTTDRGQLVIANANPRAVRFRIEGPKPIVASPAFAGVDKVVAVSVDGIVQCVDRFSGALAWRASLGENCHVTPFAVDDAVYLLTEEHHLVCFDLANGTERWRTRGIRLVLSGSLEKVYCIGEVGRILIIDNKSGNQIASVATAELDLLVQNPSTDRIYLGSRAGTLQCLREIGHPWPTIYVDREQAETALPPVIQRKRGSEDPFPSAPKQTENIDPFENP